MVNKFKGVGVALVTPFHENGNIDYDSLQKLIDYVIQNQVDYVVSLGTTGESSTLSIEERYNLLDFTAQTVANRVPIVAGFSSNNTQKVLKEISGYHFKQIDAILSASPHYNRPNQEGIYQHFDAIAKEAPLPILLYNVPSRTASTINFATTLKLMHNHNNIIGIKDASNDLASITCLLKEKREGFVVLSGDDLHTLPLIACGAEGVISVIANVLPREFSALVNFAMLGRYDKARHWHYQLANLIDLLFVEGSPGGVKAALNLVGICKEVLRLPLTKVNETIKSEILVEIQKIRTENTTKYTSIT